jgi:carbonic anhydrase/acetyltransferase-like protein (isoleucine patch superfamily)
MVAAGALVKEGQVVKSGFLVAGVPAKVIRPLSEDEKAFIKKQALHYWNDVARPYVESE